MKVSREDIKLIEEQIGRKPRSVLKVLRRCKKGYPQVILTSPVLEDGTPFPTIFWLTCPFLVKEVSNLEGKGWIKYLQMRFNEDDSLKLELKKAHDNYRRERAFLIGFREAECDGIGIGGVSNSSWLKCLHAHYAHYLATGCNPVGELVDKHIGEIGECNECEKWTGKISIN
ncbi:DUF501 domain-containing protein [Candidatus Oleimmundimicrobium sp.]|uniref:DUF501 domain-containing protein n=1 Tax=Candidatus Oleimmundimicrobium sp. TaxID=3060597 RepID=UPI00272042EB|nr:DUF501 domain-containing protein [Candidatus Oleimmundimicrobium sp.]MDO8886291.1 DUF501 domain-containing protein [Candidatus Oleimmundimicrobium sp.]